MGVAARQRIAVSEAYRYPSDRAKRLITRLFASSITRGRIGLQFADEIVEVGSGDYVCTIAPPTLSRFVAMLIKPDYRLPAYFTKGFWCCEPGRLYALLELLTTQPRSPLNGWFQLFNANPIRDGIVYKLFPLKVKRNIAEHYNTSPDFMKLILGDKLEYTCAFFDAQHQSLSAAQEHKIDLVIERLGILSEHSVLDLGCGWGQLAESVAAKSDARVTGINLSPRQVAYAREHSSSSRVQFVLTDYEGYQPSHPFDRVYSIGMLEHVGRGLLDSYFKKITDVMTADGLALVHCIVRRRHVSTNSWIDRDVFPGAYIPQLSEVTEYIERSGLEIVQVYTHDRTNYYKTLLAWTENFYRNRRELEAVLAKLIAPHDVQVVMKLWEFYLCGSRLAFKKANGECYNVQIVLRQLDQAARDRSQQRDD